MSEVNLLTIAQDGIDWVLAHLKISTVVGSLITGSIWAWRFNIALDKATQIHRSNFYSELDKLYFDLLNIAIERPHLRTPDPIPRDELALQVDYDPYASHAGGTEAEKDEKNAQYNAYAFMIWNFLETLHDRCEEYPDLLETWAPIVAAENSVHRGWFLKQMRDERKREIDHDEPAHKFCEAFRVFIHDRNFLPENSWFGFGPEHYPNWPYRGRYWWSRKRTKFATGRPNFGALGAGPPPAAKIVPRPQLKADLRQGA